MIQAADGGYVFASGSGSFSLGASISSVWKTDSSGNLLWNTTFSRDGMIWLASVIQDADGGYTELGATLVPQSNVWLQHTDSAGYKHWNVTYNGLKLDIRNLIQSSDGGYLIFACSGNQFYLIRVAASSSAVTEPPSSTPAAKILPNSTGSLTDPTQNPQTSETSGTPRAINISIPTETATEMVTTSPEFINEGNSPVNFLVFVVAVVETAVIICIALFLLVKHQNRKSGNAESNPSP